MSKRSLRMLVLLAMLLHAKGTQGDSDLSRTSRSARAFMIPLHQKQQTGWRRHLLRSGSYSVHGSVRELGYYYASLGLGTPVHNFSLIIDTGSTITYVPCRGCERCGTHQSPWFEPALSLTAKRLDCSDPLCNCGKPGCTCSESNECYYRRAYAEGSSSEGYLISDVLDFPDAKGPVPLVFGCINAETGELYRQMADGLVGMGNSDNAIQSQLVRAGVIEDVFSLCFGYPQNGLMLLGDVELPPGSPTAYTALSDGMHLHYYNVRMEGISVAGASLPLDSSAFDRGYGVVLDSGTTFTYLPTVAFDAMAKAVGEHAKARGLQLTPGADPQYNDICWKGAPRDFLDIGSFFPAAEFVFGGGARLRLPPVRYLFQSMPGTYCLSVFDNGLTGTLIGTSSMLDVVVTYDRRNGRVGFTDLNCADVAAALAARSGGGGNSQVVEISPPPRSPPAPPQPPPPLPPLPSPSPGGAARPRPSHNHRHRGKRPSHKYHT